MFRAKAGSYPTTRVYNLTPRHYTGILQALLGQTWRSFCQGEILQLFLKRQRQWQWEKRVKSMETKLEAADHCPSFPQSRRKIAKICCQWGRRGDRGRLRIGSRRSGRLHSRQCLKLNLRFAKNLLHINTNTFRYFIESICDVKCFYVSKAEVRKGLFGTVWNYDGRSEIGGVTTLGIS